MDCKFRDLNSKLLECIFSGQKVEAFPSFVVVMGSLLPGDTFRCLWLLLWEIKFQAGEKTQ